MSQASGQGAEMAGKPGALMHLVAEGLAGNGFEVGLPGSADGRRLSITSPGARCTLTVEDWGSILWEWNPAAGQAPDPLELADTASALLTGQPRQHRWHGDCRDRADLTLKGITGRELQARGLQAGLEVCTDELSFEAHTAIVVTTPGGGPEGEVWVTDDGYLSWERDYPAEAAATCSEEAECTTWITDPGKVAADIVAALALALSHNSGPAG